MEQPNTDQRFRADSSWVSQARLAEADKHSSAQPQRYPLFEPCQTFAINNCESDDAISGDEDGTLQPARVTEMLKNPEKTTADSLQIQVEKLFRKTITEEQT